jgi:HEAT repeat protein
MSGEVLQLEQSLRQGAPAERAAAAERLAQLGAEAQAAAVALVAASAAEEESVREWSVSALEGLGPPRASDVGALAAILSGGPSNQVYWAATLLGRLESSAVPARSALEGVAAAHPEAHVRRRAAWALERLGQ